MVVRGWEKLVVDSHLKPTQLFDLRQDPYEMANRVADRAYGHRREALLVELRRAMERNHDRISA
jgi:arylsulfatase A-like enzyme